MADSEAIEIQATPESILDILIDINAYPAWNKTVKEVKVLEWDAQNRPRQAQFQVNAVVKILNYVIEYDYTPDTITWRMLSGNMKRNEGSYQVIANGGGTTRLVYNFEQDPDVPLPGIFLQQGIRMGAKQQLQDLKKLMETH